MGPCFQGHVMLQQSNVFHLVASGQSLSLASTSYCLRRQRVSKINAVKLHTYILGDGNGLQHQQTRLEVPGWKNVSGCHVTTLLRRRWECSRTSRRVRGAGCFSCCRELTHTHVHTHAGTKRARYPPHCTSTTHVPTLRDAPDSKSSALACARTGAYMCIPRARSAPREGNKGWDPRG